VNCRLSDEVDIEDTEGKAVNKDLVEMFCITMISSSWSGPLLLDSEPLRQSFHEQHVTFSHAIRVARMPKDL
jgi:hypothetical protein